MAAIAELTVGYGKAYSSFILLTLGTGVGSGLVLDRKIWTSSTGYASEFGHITIDPNGPLCRCGNNGCLEQYVSATAITKRYNALSSESVKNSYEVSLLAQNGDKLAKTVFNDVGLSLGITISSLINTLGIEALIISGGVSNSIELFIDQIKTEISKRTFKELSYNFEIKRSKLGSDAGMIGAAIFAKEMSNIWINLSFI